MRTLSIIVMFINISATSENPEDQTFIGCWWLGYIICSVGVTLTAIPMWFFPKSFTNNKSNGYQNATQQLLLKAKTESENDSPKVDTFWSQLKGAVRGFVLLKTKMFYSLKTLYNDTCDDFSKFSLSIPQTNTGNFAKYVIYFVKTAVVWGQCDL